MGRIVCLFCIDLLSSAPQWMFISLLIHGAQGYFAGFKGNYRILGLLIATIVMVVAYALASVFMYGTGASIAEVIPNFCQNAFGLVVGWVLYQGFKRFNLKRLIVLLKPYLTSIDLGVKI